MNAFEKMTAFNKAHPESKDVYRKMQQYYLKNNKSDNVFCPIFEVCHYSPRLLLEIGMTGDLGKLSYDNFRYANELQIFGTWRNTLGIYRIDDDVIDDVMRSLIPNDTPVQIFERLPEWAVYIDLSNMAQNEPVKILGFWAVFDLIYINQHYARVLKIMMNFEGVDDVVGLIELPIDNDKSVEQAIQDLYKSQTDADPLIAYSYAKSDIAMLKSFYLRYCGYAPKSLIFQASQANQLAKTR